MTPKLKARGIDPRGTAEQKAMAWQDYLAKQLRDWGSAGALRVGIAGPKGCRQIRLYTGNHELVDVLIRDIVDD